MTRPRLLLLDSASLYFRAFYGVPDPRDSPDQPPSNAVRGFLDMIATLVHRHQPTHLAACWDNDWRPAFRVAAIPSYKTHRIAAGADPSAAGAPAEDVPGELGPQVPVIAQALAALGLARVGVDGFEADDVIGALAVRHRGEYAVDVVTGDRDLFQLVDDARFVRVVYTARGGVRDADLVDEAFLQERYAVSNGAAYLDLAVLRGDSSDGLPGVAGVGEKTAARLLAQYGDLAGLRRAIDAGDPGIKGALRARLEAAAAYLDVAPAVVRVAVDAPLPQVDLRVPTRVADPSAMSRLALDYDLTGPFGRVVSALRLG
ncbi:MAG: 5'-3' exonuclease H3TH domain-containing protein [Dermatophilaceae bacterium]